MRRGLAGAAGCATAVLTALAAVAPSASEASAPASRLRRSTPEALKGDSVQHEQPPKNRCERECAAMIHLPGAFEYLLGFGWQPSTCDQVKLRGRDMTTFGFARRILPAMVFAVLAAPLALAQPTLKI